VIAENAGSELLNRCITGYGAVGEWLRVQRRRAGVESQSALIRSLLVNPLVDGGHDYPLF
jgi:hypothetical protein